MSKQLRIMHIEDNDDHAELVSAAITHTISNSRIIRFDDAESGLDYLLGQEQRHARDQYPLPDMVILDLSLPGMDGREFLDHLRSNRQTAGIPVVVLTNTSNPHDIDALYRKGANSFVVKPIGYDDFVIKLAEVNMYWNGTSEIPRRSVGICSDLPSNQTANQKVEKPERTEGDISVLIVEDDPDHAILERTTLEPIGGLEIEVASSLEQAFSILIEKAFDIVILDYVLPDGFGLDILDWMSADSAVIMITGQGNEQIAAESFRHGVLNYLVKDSLFQYSLREAVEEILRERLATSAADSPQIRTCVSTAGVQPRRKLKKHTDGGLLVDC